MSLTSAEESAQTKAAVEKANEIAELLGLPAIGLRKPAEDQLATNKLDDREFADVDEQDDLSGMGNFESINLVGETVRLFRQTRKLLSKVLSDTKTPVNQQAQVANTLGTLLKGLSTQQTDLYNAERLKRLEAVVIQIVREVLPQQQDEFMRRYEEEVNVR